MVTSVGSVYISDNKCVLVTIHSRDNQLVKTIMQHSVC